MSTSGEGDLEFLILGTTEVSIGGALVRIDRQLERALAVRLALARGHGVPDEVLADDLWGEGSVGRPAERLRVLTYRLRRTLGEYGGAVRRSANGYALDGRVADLVEVEQTVTTLHAARRQGDDDGVLAAADAALARWRGPSLADLRGTPFGAIEAARLDDVRRDLRIERMAAELARGTLILGEVEQLAATNPLNERLVGLVSVALYRAGRQADALERIGRLRQALAEELGIDPSPETAELELRLLRQDPDLLAPVRPRPPASLPDRHPLSWLPEATMTFIGRDGELASLVDRLTSPTVITLTGGPGVGKTRLAREIAGAATRASRPVAWLDLTRVRRADAVLPELAAAAGVEVGTEDPLPLCVESLAGALLVIDNAEHLVDVVAELLGAVRRRRAELSVLVTSQRPLRIAGEELHLVGPLGRDAAIALFRARSELPPNDHVDSIDAICTAVDRLPLAIELAAGLTRTLTVEQLVLRIEHRLRLLTAGNRDTGGRHGSLRAAVDWSHALLDPPSQQLLHRLAVFAGGFTLEAVENVAAGGDLQPSVDPADVAAILTDLHDRSLITIDPRSETRRFGMLETVREYALEQLRAAGDEAAVRRRHASWCADLAARTQRYGGPDHTQLVRELHEEEANLRAAIGWALGPDGEPTRVLEIAAPTWWYWWSRGLMAEGRDWLRRALAAVDPAPTTARAAALRAIASLTRSSGDPAEARALGDEALRIYDELGDDTGCVSTLVGLCITGLALRDFESALRQGEEAIERARSIDNPRLLSTAVNVTGGALRGLGRIAEAERRFNEACDLWRRVDDRRGLAGTLGNLGLVYQLAGDPDRARTSCIDALRLYREIDLTEGLIDVIELIAGLEVTAGRPEPALRLLTVASANRLRIGAPLIIADELDARDSAESAARAALGEAAADRVATAAHDLSMSEIVDNLLAEFAVTP